MKFFVTYMPGTNLENCYSTLEASGRPEAWREVMIRTNGNFAHLEEGEDPSELTVPHLALVQLQEPRRKL